MHPSFNLGAKVGSVHAFKTDTQAVHVYLTSRTGESSLHVGLDIHAAGALVHALKAAMHDETVEQYQIVDQEG